MFGIIFEYYSSTHGFHRWIVVKDIPHSRYSLCAIISTKKTTHSIEINNEACLSVTKTSYIQLDNLLSVPKDIIEKNKKERICSNMVIKIKKKFLNITK